MVTHATPSAIRERFCRQLCAYAFRLDAKKNLSLVELGRSEAISAQTRAWYTALGSPRSDIAEVDRRGAALEKAVFEPLHVFDAPRRVFFRIENTPSSSSTSSAMPPISTPP